MKKSILLNLLLLISFIFIISNTSDFIISCGIFAYIGKDPKKWFNWDKFNILGVFNDSRGGDACGLITHGYYQTVHKTGTVHYKDCIIDGLIRPDVLPINHVIGHTRRASSGGYREEYTQPYVITKNHPLNRSKISKDKQYRKWSTSLLPKSILFAGVHNGTIYNMKELANKYNVKVKDQNDTQLLFDILFKKEYEVLEKYMGTASLVWHDYHEDCTYVFRGESSVTTHYKYDSEERPLFMWNIDDNNMYISSIKNSLLFIGAEEHEISDVPANKVIKIQDGKVIGQIEIDRSSSFQREPYNNTKHYGYNHSDDDDWYNNHNRTKKNSVSNLPKHINRSTEFSHNIDHNTHDNKSNNSDSLKYMIAEYTNVSYPSELRLSLEESPNFYHKYRNNSVVYNKGRYWVGNNLAHGIYALDPFGKMSHIKTVYQNEFSFLKLYYFVEGIKLDNASDYFLTKKLCDEIRISSFNYEDKLKSIEVVNYETELLANITPFTKVPFTSLIDYNVQGFTGLIYKAYTIISEDKRLSVDINPYSGMLKATFAKRTYEVTDGTLTKIENIQPALPTHNKESHKEAMEYLRDQSTLFVTAKTGDSHYIPDSYDKIGFKYYHDDKILCKPHEFSPSFLSQILNRIVIVEDCVTYHPHLQQHRIGFNTSTAANDAIKNVATALLVHFKTFQAKKFKCLNCKKRNYINDECFSCFKERKYFLNTEYSSQNIK